MFKYMYLDLTPVKLGHSWIVW